MNIMIDKVYYQLRKEIDERMPVGMPPGDDDAAVRILASLFTPEEAGIAIHLSILPERIKKIHRRLKKNGLRINEPALREVLDSMVTKGLIMGDDLESDNVRYSLAQFAVGIYEFQVNRQTPEFAQLAEAYHNEALASEFFHEKRPVQLRTVPVNAALTGKKNIATYDDIGSIIAGADEPIAVMDCVCKETRDILKEPCRLSDVRSNCIMFGDTARFFLERKVPSARRVSRDELLRMIDTFRKIGFILQPANNRKPGFLCVCCGCCCNVIRGYKRLPRPSQYFQSNYYAEIVPSLCNGCGRCVTRCQMDAISLVNEKGAVDLDRCIGCGNCVEFCKKNAIILHEKEKKKRPPRNSRHLYTKILFNKKGFVGTVATVLKLMSGRKV
ncbi:MAG TPA: 4Fe-4S binding protein [Spirochaetota bacterium]|nr:4Fe-4S binding protein [Spirochaetota bacterium]HPI89072.1 4Fe-4S binding protein [Spirochaetota bacterium]HPR48717.1 4Fe-4S binding protein [Spirochaetota bacterium]